MSVLLDAAVRYAELGYAVFPCAPGAKTPLTPRGFLDATTECDQIERWWAVHPTANVAIATAGLVVVDVDGPHNPWLTDKPERALEMAAAPLSLTPGGGRHFLFRSPADKSYRCQAGRLAPHVDVRAEGGYIVAPPSVLAGGKAYVWSAGSPLDASPQAIPEPPAWLVEQLDRTTLGAVPATSSPTAAHVGTGGGTANTIPTGQRNATLARLAGTMRRVGMSRAEISAALDQANRDRCAPPLSPAEVEEIAQSVARYEPDQVAVAVAENHWQQARPQPKPDVEFVGMTSRELAASQFDLVYAVDGLLVKGQPGVLAGPKKTLKTNISVDLAISLAQGDAFLGRFPVSTPMRAGVMSGESGAATIQETARRVAKSKGFALEQCDKAFWCFDVPQLGDVLHTKALRAFIERYALEALILDPTYLMMMNLGDNAGNLFVVGALLKSLAELAQQTQCTPILCHHLKKGIADPYEPAELENIAWAGFQEFVRQWILLNRRVRYDPDRGGHHELWMSVGGSAGHSGLWGLNIEEGTRQDAAGRHWEVEVIAASDAFAQRDESKERAKEERKLRRDESRHDALRQAVIDLLRTSADGETERAIRERLRLSGPRCRATLDALVAERAIEACEVAKANGQSYRGYRLVKENSDGHWDTGTTHWDAPRSQ